MNSLVIGNTSQLAHYFPEEYEKISSRNIDLLLYSNKFYDRVFITFAEQRLHEIKSLTPYLEVNVNLTLKLINFFKDRANYIVVYGTCELWNNYMGDVDINDKFDYDTNSTYTGYCISKQIMVEQIKQLENDNIIILHPFNFNSIYRKPGFLFSKIFDSIINNKKINIGDTYFYRDLIHPKYLAEKSIIATQDELIGSGRLTFINDFIRKLYEKNNLNYEDYVTETFNALTPKKKVLYLRSKTCLYDNLLEDTINDIIKLKLK